MNWCRSLSSGVSSTAPYIFATSPDMATGKALNQMRISVKCRYRVGPTISVALRDVHVLVLAEAHSFGSRAGTL